MKPFDFKYGRKQETNDEKEENVILMEESEDEDFGSFLQEMKAADMVEVIYLESSVDDFSTRITLGQGGWSSGIVLVWKSEDHKFDSLFVQRSACM
ncbi:hypothetical protein AVEN_63011-1 [Araneus ventricosus]|uniref:Uncharacterized protein n=1 Tax=Araneus ventricosus TaxID=182803 RepID=A0A4Y2CSC6_ARAVE|nr:hypothetical protein AVEN_63011-1 [Araneus ventricosus]